MMDLRRDNYNDIWKMTFPASFVSLFDNPINRIDLIISNIHKTTEGITLSLFLYGQVKFIID